MSSRPPLPESKHFSPHQARAHVPSLLIVDDQQILAEYMAVIAGDHGLRADIACTAGEFETKLHDQAPDAISLDLSMPGRDGVQLLRHLADAHYDGSVLIVSSCDRDVLETSFRLGGELGLKMVGAASKPINPDGLAALYD